MADPLSVAGSVVGIISLGIQVTQSLVDYYTAIKNQESFIADTTKRLERLLEVFQLLRAHIDGRKFRTEECKLLSSILSSVEHCEEYITELQDEVDKFKTKSNSGIQAAARATTRRIAYPFRQSTLQKLDEGIDGILSHLSLAQQLLHQTDIGNVQEDVEDVKALLSLVRASQISSEIHEWLKAPDSSTDLNAAYAKRHSGTGLCGFAGCGKSVLSSTAIQYAYRHKRSNPQVGIAYFFFTFNNEGKQDTSAMLRALVLQLAGQLNNHTLLSKLHDSSRNVTPPNHSLIGCLRQLVRGFNDVYITLDALDESPRENHREAMLQALSDMRAWSEPGLHLLVTSRDEIDIRDELGALPNEEIIMKNNAIDKDISCFISQHLRQNRRLGKWGKYHKRIETVLAERAGGV
ncbi:hypothetical protein G7Z17_g5112 [Cylindrodendrum hubeiense]|uniref:NACHT domain-containing protein n=1 Tax=Cylindrodendrum hubeiense TaxID=595255 RepID=A0A9P5H7F1_9HYPO|nr:hypothetical protein G7Z17_g5112 [Cylindrodendrum hubeiense]